MKILEDKYPKGTLPNQKTDGRYVDETLYANFEILAQNIVRDMTFLLFVFSSTLEVGTGKSVFVSQLGELWQHLMKKIHNIDVPFDINNCVFRPKELIERSFKVPQYSFMWLDEWEDTHYWSELGMSLRQFFRKCRQLNLCMVCIIPSFFELPKGYAISRSVGAIDIKFEGEFERGYFRFFNFDRKKDLYLNGKKNYDYSVAKPNFIGRFTDGMPLSISKEVYNRQKRIDLEKYEEVTQGKVTEIGIKVKLFRQLHQNLPEITMKKLAEAFGVSSRTGSRWLSDEYNSKIPTVKGEEDTGTEYNKNLIESEEND